MDDKSRRPRFVCHPGNGIEDTDCREKTSLPTAQHESPRPGFFEMTPGRRQLLIGGGSGVLAFLAYVARRYRRASKELTEGTKSSR